MGLDDSNNQNVAQILADLGLRTFPLIGRTKRPAVEKFYDRASCDPDHTTESHNVGVATGDGIIVLDFDVKPDKGINALDLLASLDMLGLPHSLRVRSANDGVHAYFRTDRPIANAVNTIGPGVDIRCEHGYVVAPGSIVDGKTYEIIGPVPHELAICPDHILDRLTAPRERQPGAAVPATPLDTPAAIAAATRYLTHTAPEAIEFNGGDITTYGVACHIRDLGVSQATATTLMLDHWNHTKAIPPWSPDEIEDKTASAFRYGQNAPGVKAPPAEFTDALTPEQLAHIEATRKMYFARPAHEDQPDTTPKAPLTLQPLQPYNLATDVRPREYVLGKFLAKRYVTALISPPGIGKTTFGLSTSLSIATGKPILGPKFGVKAPADALYWTQEDDLDEIRMRLSAAMRVHGLTFEDTLNENGVSRLHLFSGVDRPLAISVFAEDRRSLLPSQDANTIAAYIKSHNIAAAVFDPFLEFHPADENSNGEIGQVARIFRKIATSTNAAVGIVHHTRKHNAASADTAAGDMDSGRGAGALMGVVRVAATLYGLDEKTAKLYGVPEDQRRAYVRFDDAKSNLALLDSHPSLFRRESVWLPEIDDEVGVLVPATDLVRIEKVDVDQRDLAADTASAVAIAWGRGARSIGWGHIARALLADEFAAAVGEPGKYALAEERSLARRIQRLFDPETGVGLFTEIEGLEARKCPKGWYVFRLSV